MRSRGVKVVYALWMIGVTGCPSRSSRTGDDPPSMRLAAPETVVSGVAAARTAPTAPANAPEGKAVPAMGGGPGRSADAFGLTRLTAESLERISVVRPQSQVTVSGWRMQVRCDQGVGAIERDDVSSARSYFYGDGVFLGWSDVHLAEVFGTLVKERAANEAPMEMLQLD